MVRLMHAVLHKALKDAERLGLIAFNPLDRVSPPKAPRPAIQVWDEEHFRAFLRVVEHDHYGPIWLVALATGMREGELLGLRWRNVDLDDGTIAVREIVTLLDGKLQFRPRTKTGKARVVHIDPGTIAILRAWRIVQLERRVAAPVWQDRDLVFPNEVGGPIYARNLLRHFDVLQARAAVPPPDLVAQLRIHRARQNEHRLLLGSAWRDHGLVCASEVGTPIIHRNMLRAFRAICETAGVPRIRPYDLRHTGITLMLRGNADLKAVSEIAGHADVRITRGVYQHVDQTQRAHALETLAAALREDPDTSPATGDDESGERSG
jgi:integrase